MQKFYSFLKSDGLVTENDTFSYFREFAPSIKKNPFVTKMKWVRACMYALDGGEAGGKRVCFVIHIGPGTSKRVVNESRL